MVAGGGFEPPTPGLWVSNSNIINQGLFVNLVQKWFKHIWTFNNPRININIKKHGIINSELSESRIQFLMVGIHNKKMFSITLTSKINSVKKIRRIEEEELSQMVGSFIIYRAKTEGKANVVVVNNGESFDCEVRYSPN